MNALSSTAALVLNPGKYLDWRTWLLGLWSNSAVAGATCVTSFLTTNGAEASMNQLPWDWAHTAAQSVGMGWKTALAQFVIHVVLAAAKYVSDTKGVPPEKTNPPMPPP